MSDRSALLRAIATSPDDLLVRLVYADYLDETGQPEDAKRAEFIRAQCEYARLAPPRGGSLTSDLPVWETWQSAYKDAFAGGFAIELAEERKQSPELARLEQLQEQVRVAFAEHGSVWVAEAATPLGLPMPVKERGGFWRGMRVLAAVAKRAGSSFIWGPTSVAGGDAKGLPAGFRRLVFWCGFADELWIDPTLPSARTILEKWLDVGPTRRLVLTETGDSRGDFWPTADHLRSVGTVTLDLQSDTHLYHALGAAHDAGVKAAEVVVRGGMGNTLAASDVLRDLRHLQLTFLSYNDLGELAVVGTPDLRQLVLDFDFVDEMQSAGEEFFARSAEYMATLANGHLGVNLESLAVQYAAGNADFVRHVCAAPAWKHLRTLHLNFPLNPACVVALGESQGLPALTDLTVCLDRRTMRSLPRTPAAAPRPIPVAKPVGGPVLVARRVGAPPLAPSPAPVPVAAPLPDANGWVGAIRALSKWPGLATLRRLRLTVRPMRANTLADVFPSEKTPFVGLPWHALGWLAAALATGGRCERLEIAGCTVDSRGRAEMDKHLPGRVVYV